MTKTRTKKIIQEKTPQERAKEGYSYEKACNAAKNSGIPTYRFAVGDRVQVGHLPNCVVEEVLDDGAMYLIRVTTKDNTNNRKGILPFVQFTISHEERTSHIGRSALFAL